MSQSHDSCVVIRSFPQTVHIRLQPDIGRPILIAGTDAEDCMGQIQCAAVGVYRLEQLLEIERRITERRIEPRAADRRRKR